MLGSLVRWLYWSLALAAALGLVLAVSSAQAANKNPGDPFSLGVVNSIDQTTTLSGSRTGMDTELFVTSEPPGSIAVLGQSSGDHGVGVVGQGYGVIGARGVLGVSGSGTAVEGDSVFGTGVRGASASAPGVFGVSDTEDGVQGFSNSGSGAFGSSKAGPGVNGESVGSPGVFGNHIGPDGDAAGVEGDTASTASSAVGVLGKVTSIRAGSNSAAVRGVNNGSGSGVEGVNVRAGKGVFGSSDSGPGVYGQSSTGPGVIGNHTNLYGAAPAVEGDTASTAASAVGVLGAVTSTGPGSSSVGVRGINNGRGYGGIGVWGSQDGSGWGVLGTSQSGNGVRAISVGGVAIVGVSQYYAAAFRGHLQLNGDLEVVNGHTKNFRIDDPLDPKHKYLVHAAIESNEVLNIYSGNITTDQQGTATVRLPAYFDRINTDIRYQLTVVDQFAQAIIAEKEAANRFVIRTDKPHVEVSWQVTARRNDPYLRAHPFHDIRTKTKADRRLTAQLEAKPGSQASAR
jgi:hypothetical protein